MSMSDDLRIVIVGGGRVGYHTASRLENRGHNIVMIEDDRERVEFLSDQYMATVIKGNGGRPSILREANLKRSDVIAALTSGGAMTNIGICLTAQRIAPEIKTVARIDGGSTEEYEEMVDSVVYPEALAAHTAANEVIDVSTGGVRTIEGLTGEIELLEIEIAEGAPAAGKELQNVSFPRGSIIVANQHDGSFPGAETVLEPGQQFILAVKTNVTDEVIQLLRG